MVIWNIIKIIEYLYQFFNFFCPIISISWFYGFFINLTFIKFKWMERLDNIINKFLKDRGFDKKLSEFNALSFFNQEVVTKYPQIEESYAIDIQNGNLKVLTHHSTLKYEFFLIKNQIIEMINQHFSSKIVKDITVLIGRE